MNEEILNEESSAQNEKTIITEKENPDIVEVTEEAESVDYEALMESDINKLKEEFPELIGKTSITELENPIRYAALRDLGLSPEEAYLATTKSRRVPDTRSHLTSAVPKFASTTHGVMSDAELNNAREIFHGLSDSEIRKLYRKVTS